MLSGAMMYMESMIIKNLIVMIFGWVTFKEFKADAVRYIPSFYSTTIVCDSWNTGIMKQSLISIRIQYRIDERQKQLAKYRA